MEIKDCKGKLLQKYSLEKLKKHYAFMEENNAINYQGYIQSSVVSQKYWDASKEGKIDPDACEVCVENAKVGAIPLETKFPSGHLYPPAGYFCRCILGGVT